MMVYALSIKVSQSDHFEQLLVLFSYKGFTVLIILCNEILLFFNQKKGLIDKKELGFCYDCFIRIINILSNIREGAFFVEIVITFILLPFISTKCKQSGGCFLLNGLWEILQIPQHNHLKANILGYWFDSNFC